MSTTTPHPHPHPRAARARRAPAPDTVAAPRTHPRAAPIEGIPMTDANEPGFERVSAENVHLEGRTLTVGRLIHAPAADIFELLADPNQQIDADGMDMVRGAVEGTEPITKVGDVFRMRMFAEVMGGDYEMDNHVTRFEQDVEIGWMPARPEREPHGVQWTWRLEPEDDESTYVSLVYDWDAVTNEKMLAREFPPFPIEAYTASLEALAETVEDRDLEELGGDDPADDE